MYQTLISRRLRVLGALSILGTFNALGAFGVHAGPSIVTDDDKASFMASLQQMCGKAFEGQVISTDAADADIAKETLVMHVRECTDTQIKIPFHVGKNRSRTWVISQDQNQITLKHDHRHENGHEDKITQYGGTSMKTIHQGPALRREFPVDEYSKTMFKHEGLNASLTNVWAIEVKPNISFIYELSRPSSDLSQPGRLFRVSFDLSRPITPPPAPWGHENTGNENTGH
jgi:hypothetical protein